MTLQATQTNTASDSVSVQVQANDPDGDALSYSATNLPDGLSIDPSSGLITGVLADDAAGSGAYAVTVTATDGNGQSVSQTFNWIVNAPPITAQGVSISAVEGVDPGSIIVATFTTPDLNTLADDFTATIDWGDGTTDTGVISGGNGSFTVTDDHIYAEIGSYPVTITIADSLTGSTATVATTATVTDAPLTLTGGFQLGDPMSNPVSTFTLATFTDANVSASASDYSVTINWGDGSSLDTGAYVQSMGAGTYEIVAPHSYSLTSNQVGPLTYTVTVTLNDVDGASASTTSTIVVGQLAAGVPAYMDNWGFADQNPNATPSDFVVNGQSGVALINWGDGTTSLGTITGGNDGGTSAVFDIAGTHTYAQDSYDQPNGQYQITVTVTDDDGSTLTGTQYVSVVRPQESLNVANVDIASSLTVSNEPVAVFTVPNATDAAGEFTAQINWGDGNTSSGTVQEVAPGLFQVLGSHTYATYDWYNTTVTISQGWQQYVANAKGNGVNGGKPIILINKDYKNVSTLTVGRWITAFNKQGQFIQNPKKWNNNVKGEYFVSLDPARFYLQVEDKAAKGIPGQIRTIETTIASSSDSGHKITLTETGINTGIFRSNPLLLTTFAIDKNAGGDQTLNVKLRDTVSAIYGKKEAEATVPVRAVVKLHINILRITPGGDPVATIAQVKKDVLMAQKIYAAAGIRLAIAGNIIQVVNPPAKMANYKYRYFDKNGNLQKTTFNYLQSGLLSRFIWGPNWTSRGEVRVEKPESYLLGDTALRCKCNRDIEVYYINYFAQKNGLPFNSGYGESFPYSLVSQTMTQYSNSVIIAAATEAENKTGNYIYQTLAHEIGHILINNGDHKDVLVGLMYNPPRSAGSVTDTRRITPENANKMLNNMRNLLMPPP